jgi:hypothetical protein
VLERGSLPIHFLFGDRDEFPHEPLEGAELIIGYRRAPFHGAILSWESSIGVASLEFWVVHHWVESVWKADV